MLLVLTHSRDCTTDDVLGHLPDLPIFRFNIDLWRDFEWKIGADDYSIKDPYGRVCRERDVRAVYLRKLMFEPHLIEIPVGGSEEHWTRSELEQVWLGLRDWAHETGKLALVAPSPNGRWSKIRQMKAAGRFFRVPEWQVIHSAASELKPPVVVKTLAAANVGNGGIVAVREVDENMLSDRHPWFLQAMLIEATHDVTVTWVDGQMFAYQIDRRLFEGADCRMVPSDAAAKWEPCKLSKKEADTITAFMCHTGLKFGRLDFLRNDEGLWFLEVNPNGQFAWLDPWGENGLLKAVADAIRKVWIANG